VQGITLRLRQVYLQWQHPQFQYGCCNIAVTQIVQLAYCRLGMRLLQQGVPCFVSVTFIASWPLWAICMLCMY
jgi:hypothetical protein